MARRHGIVLDSDDEASEASPGPSTYAPDAKLSRETVSTDPSFFRRVYDEQVNASPMAESGAVNGPVEDVDLIKIAPSHDGRTYDSIESQTTRGLSSLTSITEPSANRRKTANSGDVEATEHTQISTPHAPTTRNAVWDVPSSATPAEPLQTISSSSAKRKTPAKTYGKRKRTPRSSASGSNELPAVKEGPEGAGPVESSIEACRPADADEDYATPTRPRKRTKTHANAIIDDLHDDSLVVNDDRSSSIIAEKSIGRGRASLVLATSKLTSSQRREYQVIHTSSDDHDAAPTQPPSTKRSAHRSSGSATIAYPTPSEYASSNSKRARKGADLKDQAVDQQKPTAVYEDDEVSSLSQQPAKQADRYQLASSPDVISAAPARAGAPKRPQPVSSSPDRHSISSRVRQAKHKQVQRFEAEDVSDAAPSPSRTFGVKGRSTKRRAPAAPEGDDDIAKPEGRTPSSTRPLRSSRKERPGEVTRRSSPPPSSGPSRGMNKAKAELGSPGPISQEDVEKKSKVDVGIDVMPAPENDRPTKRKRGRPRKPDSTHSQLEENDEENILMVASKSDPSAGNASVAEEEYDEEVQSTEEEQVSRRTPKKTKKKSKTTPQSQKAAKSAAANGPTNQPLQDISASAKGNGEVARGADVGEKSFGVSEDKGKENHTMKQPALGKMVSERSKEVAPASQSGKNIVRVGLSKRTRIAPLLKIIQK